MELAKKLNTSQQTASRYLLELDKNKLINRELGVKKQLIKITSDGKNILRNEYTDYTRIFKLENKIFFKGKVVSGLGEGRYYTEQNGYRNQFKEKLGFIPHPGTLNVKIEYIEKNKLRLLKNNSAIIINEFKTDSRTFGKVRCFNAEIEGIKGAIVLPFRSHYSNILEFISPIYLREKLDLDDGNNVNIVIFLKKLEE